MANASLLSELHCFAVSSIVPEAVRVCMCQRLHELPRRLVQRSRVLPIVPSQVRKIRLQTKFVDLRWSSGLVDGCDTLSGSKSSSQFSEAAVVW